MINIDLYSCIKPTCELVILLYTDELLVYGQ